MSIISLDAARSRRVPRRDPKATAIIAEQRHWLVRILDFASQSLDQLDRCDRPLDKIKAGKARYMAKVLKKSVPQ
jgi:hypothetical protein